ncbi:His-Xaa-Ser system radical SAM maturase HxsC [Chitinophaga sancti]|uniref:His-Xaa-Ser system radical SAM maturase HxsC n=1 Tax=Chitinophaga sancti TaxID=1004 RepID=UPI002A75747F|nr:His-Xaa-Ser system radical SAM maturase HxsC [Chitinophaga sancti]WPQ63292.1 His-Xaa-Ser system radical SAM maturase HxsC [Chitinophaga sancti]
MDNPLKLMVLRTKGIPNKIDTPIVGRISFSGSDLLVNSECILSTGSVRDMPGVYGIGDLSHLYEGDIVVVHADGVVNTVYRVNSVHNFLLFTERCNSNCLMCSQPPKDKDDTDYLYYLHSKTIPLIPKDCFELGITGGEPTLLGERYFKLLEQIQYELPNTEVHCLTNGRSFAWPNIAGRLGDMHFRRLMLGIPIYSDYPAQHDYIVQAKDAFNQTVKGLYNLAKQNVRIELRIVLHQQTIPRLMKLAKFIYKNLPFAEHVTFMGLEYQGYTPHNIDKLWIDPLDYGEVLSDAVSFLGDMGMRVSIYNSQLCTIPKDVWGYARRSISDWKNVYHEACEGCGVKEQCGGFFASGMKKHSRGIMAIV